MLESLTDRGIKSLISLYCYPNRCVVYQYASIAHQYTFIAHISKNDPEESSLFKNHQ